MSDDMTKLVIPDSWPYSKKDYLELCLYNATIIQSGPLIRKFRKMLNDER
jgi:hypothetical protein